MAQRIAGAGVGLPYPSNLYPSELFNSPPDVGTNLLTLVPGQTLILPAGRWFVNLSSGAGIEFLDPVTNTWKLGATVAGGGFSQAFSDGTNVRIANFSGCPVAAGIVAGGSGYVQASTTVTPSAGASTWQAIVGGALSVTSVTNAGSGYGITPLVLIPAPPSPGVPAQAVAILASGTVSSVAMINPGAGYIQVPTATIVPVQTDPNYGTTQIVNAQVTLGLTSSGAITAVLNTNPGNSLTAVPTLTVAGAGTAASVTVNAFTGGSTSAITLQPAP